MAVGPRKEFTLPAALGEISSGFSLAAVFKLLADP
jgi:hypothetical protein